MVHPYEDMCLHTLICVAVWNFRLQYAESVANVIFGAEHTTGPVWPSITQWPPLIVYLNTGPTHCVGTCSQDAKVITRQRLRAQVSSDSTEKDLQSPARV
jgi:hypothetical protein